MGMGAREIGLWEQNLAAGTITARTENRELQNKRERSYFILLPGPTLLPAPLTHSRHIYWLHALSQAILSDRDSVGSRKINKKTLLAGVDSLAITLDTAKTRPRKCTQRDAFPLREICSGMKHVERNHRAAGAVRLETEAWPQGRLPPLLQLLPWGIGGPVWPNALDFANKLGIRNFT